MNKYEELVTIGEGQYGIVQKARNKETGELVAIKKFKEDYPDDQFQRMILREVKILKTLKHQNIVELKEAFRKQFLYIEFVNSLAYFRKGKIFLVFEYVDRNLLQLLQQNQIDRALAKDYIYQLLQGLHYMHSLNIVYRDIKPENILISAANVVKICDMGFARIVPPNGFMTEYVATRWYRPPELLVGKCDYTKAIDVWSVGCVMAEMIDGEPLFPGENDLDQLYLIQKCLGSLLSSHQQHFLKNPKFIGMKFPDIYTSESLERKYASKVDKLRLDLLKKLLKMDPAARITADEALRHPYFNAEQERNEADKQRNSYELHRKQDHSNAIGNHRAIPKSMLPLNNFMQAKQESKILIGKGLSKLKRTQGECGMETHVNNFLHISKQKGVEQFLVNKGKSLGHKRRQRQSGSTAQTHGRKYRMRQKDEQKPAVKEYDHDDYYEQKWEQDESYRKQDSPRLNKKESPRRRESNKSPIKKKMQKVSIIYNHNTFNLNLIEPYH